MGELASHGRGWRAGGASRKPLLIDECIEKAARGSFFRGGASLAEIGMVSVMFPAPVDRIKVRTMYGLGWMREASRVDQGGKI
jgi:hypothetical protein